MNRSNDRKQHALPAFSRLRRKVLPLTLSLLGLGASLLPYGEAVAAGPPAGTLPTGNSIVSGAATVNTTGTTLTVNQTSAQLAMNWTSFDIASNATVTFNQPSANAIALNRIGIGAGTPTASQIYGNLNANGQVFLINPAGIVFGSGAQLNVGGLVASTLDLDPTTLAGGAQSFHLDRASTTGAVINHGTIQAATGGGVVLAGGSVSNDGLIVANAGHIFMDGAEHATLDFDGNNLINVTVTGALASGAGIAVNNTGTLQADDGMVVLQASATPGLFTQMVNNGGLIQADSIGGSGGTVQLIGAGGDVVSSNQISANGSSGGRVQLSSDRAVNASGALSASGGSSGSIALGGNALTLAGTLDAGAGQLALTSTGAISQTGGTLTAGTLTGSAGGAVTLNQANQLQGVDSFTANSTFSLSNARTLSVNGLNAIANNVALTTAAGADLNFNGHVDANVLTLNSGGNITQNAGTVYAIAVRGQSTGSTTLLGPGNRIVQVAGFNANGFSLNSTVALANNGALSSSGDVTLATSGGNLRLFGAVSGANVSLSASNGAILQSGNALTATRLSGNAAGAVTLTRSGNQVGQLDGFSANGFSLTNAGALRVNGTVNGGANVTLTTGSGDLTVAGPVNGSNVVLNASTGAIHFDGSQIGGALNATAGGGIGQNGALSVTGDTTLSSGGAIALNNPSNALGGLVNLSGSSVSLINRPDLRIGSLVNGPNGEVTLYSWTGGLYLPSTPINTGTANITLVSSGGMLTTAADLSGYNILLAGSSGVSLGHRLTATNDLSLNSNSAAIAQTAGSLSAATLSANGVGAVTLTQATNQIGRLNTFLGNGLSLVNSSALLVGGPVRTTGNIALTTNGDLTLAGTVSGSDVALNANGGAISQTAGQLTAARLSGSSTGATTLTQASNAVSQLNGFAANGFSLINGGALTVNGPLASSGGVALTTGSGDLTLAGAVSGTRVALNASAGAITQTAGSLTATSLSGGSSGATTLTQAANQVANLGAYASGGDFALSNGVAIQQTGALQVQGVTTLDAAASAIALNNAGNALAGQVNATGAGIAITNAGNLTIGALNNGANGAVNLLATNGALSLPATAIATGTSDLTLVSGNGTLATAANLSGAKLSLAGSGGVTIGHQVLATNGLDITSSGGDISQSAALKVSGASSFHAAGAIALDDAGNALGGPVSASGASIAIANGGDLDIAALNNGVNGAVSLSSTNGKLLLPGSAIDTGSADLSLSSGGGTLATAADLRGANVNLAGSGGVTLGHQVSAANTLAIASSRGAIVQTAGSLAAGTLSGGSLGATSLNQGNAIQRLGDFTANGFSLTNAQSLTIGGPLRSGGAIALTTSAGDLAIDGAVSGSSVALNTAGAISEGASGGIVAAGLSGRSGGATSLNQSNRIGSLGGFDAQDFSLVNGQGLTVDGVVQGGGNLALITTSGDLALNAAVNGGQALLRAAGALVEGNGGRIVATSLSGSSGGSAMLTQANQVDGLHGFSSGGDFSFSNNGAIRQDAALVVAGNSRFQSGSQAIVLTDAGNRLQGAVSASGAGIAIASAGDLAIAGLSTGGQAVSLYAGGSLRLPNAAIDTGSSDLSLISAGGALATAGALSGANIALSARDGLTLSHDVSAAHALSLLSGGAITQNAGALAAASLSGRSVGATALGTRERPAANRIGVLGGFSAPGGFSLTNEQTLTLAALGGSSFSVDAGSASLYLAVRQGDLLQSATTPLYDGQGVFAASGRIGTASAPLYVFGSQPQVVESIGMPPAYFYALDRQGQPLAIHGQSAVNIPGARTQPGDERLDPRIEAGAIAASYRAFGMGPAAARLPAEQEACDPAATDCPRD